MASHCLDWFPVQEREGDLLDERLSVFGDQRRQMLCQLVQIGKHGQAVARGIFYLDQCRKFLSLGCNWSIWGVISLALIALLNRCLGTMSTGDQKDQDKKSRSLRLRLGWRKRPKA